MTEIQLRDMAYRKATGNHLVRDFSFKQFQRCNVSNHIWEPLEYLGDDTVIDMIVSEAEAIISVAKLYKGE